MVLRGDGIVLRPWQEGDAAALVKHADNRKVWRNMTDTFPHPYTVDDAHAWLGRCAEDTGPASHFAITVNGEPVGGAGLVEKTDVQCKTLETGYWLGEAYWGRGIATQAARLVVRHAFEHFDVERIEAGVFGWNPASARVLEKVGFTFEAPVRPANFKDGTFNDRPMYALLG